MSKLNALNHQGYIVLKWFRMELNGIKPSLILGTKGHRESPPQRALSPYSKYGICQVDANLSKVCTSAPIGGYCAPYAQALPVRR